MNRIVKYLLILVLLACGTPNNDYESPVKTDNEGMLMFGDTNFTGTQVIYNDSTVVKTVIRDSVVMRYKDSLYIKDSLRITDSLRIKDSLEIYTNLVESLYIQDSIRIKDSLEVRDTLVQIYRVNDYIHSAVINNLKQIVTLQNTYYAYHDEFYTDKFFIDQLTILPGDTISELGYVHPGTSCPFYFKLEVVGDSLNVKAIATSNVNYYSEIKEVTFYGEDDIIAMDYKKRITDFPLSMCGFYAQQILDGQAEYYSKNGYYSIEETSFDVLDFSGEIGFIHPGDHIPFIFTFYGYTSGPFVYAKLKKDYGIYTSGIMFKVN